MIIKERKKFGDLTAEERLAVDSLPVFDVGTRKGEPYGSAKLPDGMLIKAEPEIDGKYGPEGTVFHILDGGSPTP